jgi:folate-binding protein YgfZ
MARLNMYKLRRQVLIEDANENHAAIFSPEPFEGAAPDPRFPDGALGWRALGAADASPENGAEVFEASRLALGAPDLARDADPEEVFALEALFEELHGVDFQKGCFVGQETVSRMKRRATTRKKFCPIIFDHDAPSPGTPLLAGENEVGSVRTGAPGRAIAFLRLDRALEAVDKGAALTAAGKPVRLDPPPWLIVPTRTEGET